MFDPISQGLAAVSERSVYAPALVFAAGAVSSAGPCVAPRFIAVAGLAAGKPRPQGRMLVLAFVAGLCATYAAFGAVSPLLARASHFSNYTYAAVAFSLAIGGAMTLWRGQERCGHTHSNAQRGFGGALLLGASFALVVSPCCTPLLAGILAYASASGSAGYASSLLACFALGHALPVVAAGFGMQGVSRALERHGVGEAAGVVSAALMLGLAGYYAVLA